MKWGIPFQDKPIFLYGSSCPSVGESKFDPRPRLSNRKASNVEPLEPPPLRSAAAGLIVGLIMADPWLVGSTSGHWRLRGGFGDLGLGEHEETHLEPRSEHGVKNIREWAFNRQIFNRSVACFC